jgi:predicted dehydrogenase
LRWGILGTGAIAHAFSADLLLLPDHEIVAIGSRSQSSADEFAASLGTGPRAHGSYADLAADDGVDVVYIATPHSGHHPAALLCLKAGRAVLVEKPFGLNAEQAVEVAEAAKAADRFCLEAMWTRFNPVIARVRDLVADGGIGDVRAVYADFGFAASYDPAGRLFDPALGGGALLDLGIYPVSLAAMLLGPPSTVKAIAGTAPTGVDANTGILLGYRSGAVAVLHASLQADTPTVATIMGTTGRIELPTPFFKPSSLTLHRRDTEPDTFSVDLFGGGYTYQAQEVARCMRAGLLESPLLPLAETIAIMRTMDAIRADMTALDEEER